MKRLTLLLACMIGLLSTQAVAQPLSIDFNLPEYDLFYIGDLDPGGELESMSSQITMALIVHSPGTYIIDYQLEFGTNLELVTGQLRAEGVHAGDYGPWNLTEMRSGSVSDQGITFRGQGEYNQDFLEQISGNTLPSGTYRLSARYSHDGQTYPGPTVTIQIQDPRRVDLQLPWNGGTVYSEQPNFSWSGRARAYCIRVCRFDPDFHASMQEALQGDPEWSNENLHAPNAVYGQGGSTARPLEPGETYVWQVEAILETTSGERRFPSEIRSFRFLAPGGGMQPTLAQLLDGLNPGQLAGLGHLLSQLSLDGPITIDGRQVSPAEFQEFLQDIASGELNIASMRIE